MSRDACHETKIGDFSHPLLLLLLLHFQLPLPLQVHLHLPTFLTTIIITITLTKQRQKSDTFFPRWLGEAHDSFLRNEAGQVRHLITIATSTDEAAVSAALLGLGGPSPAHRSPEEVLRVVARWALVGIGPESAKHWRQENAKEAL